ncbi:MAG: hypothetical protein ABJE95_00475 [Byssovorax sp.]
MTTPPPQPGKSPRIRLTDADNVRLMMVVEAVARPYYSHIKDWRKERTIEAVTALVYGRVHSWTGDTREATYVACDLCGGSPTSGWFTNIVLPPLRDGRPTFEVSMGKIAAKSPAICAFCLRRDWVAWEPDVVAILGILGRGSPVERDAAGVLEDRFNACQVRIGVGRCTYCGAHSSGLRGLRAFVCAECMATAKVEFARAEAKREAEEKEAARLDEERKNRPFPAGIRAKARRVAAHVGVRRAEALGPPPERPRDEAADAAWEEMRRRHVRTSSSYSFMESYLRMTETSTPPADVVDSVGAGLAAILESVALDGYRLRHQGRLTGNKDVVGESWVVQDAGRFLWKTPPSRAVRARIDEATVLLRRVLSMGINYQRWDEGMYDDVTMHYHRFVTHLYDYRDPSASALYQGALLLHGGRAEDREEVAREIHHALTGGLDRLLGRPFVIVGGAESEVVLGAFLGEATVYIPDPLALSREDQAVLARRLAPDNPAMPTILGADDEPSFREQAQSRLLEELVPRLYTFELDVRPELSRRGSAG